jgi:hypothetical protein
MSNTGPGGSEDEFFVLAEALRAFKTGPLSDNPSDRALARAAGVSPTTIGDWLRGKRFPHDISKVLIVVRMVRDAAAARGVTSPGSGAAGLLDDGRWRAAHQEEAQRRAGAVSDAVQRAQAISVLAGPTGRVRAGEADPRWLGVHAAISVPGVPDEVPPEYVPRDADAAEFGVRARVAAAAEQGGFVLLVGGSSVGKTRSAVEAVRALLPNWWLVHPAGPGGIAALAAAPSPRTVMWLDDLQRYLDGEHGLTGAVVRALLGASTPVVIIGTLWPDRYTAYTTVPAPRAPDPHAREREVLDLAIVIRIAPEFTSAEQDRARAAAARDVRLRVALNTAGYGLTQTLAAAPQLVARWEDAQTIDPYAWAVLTAALDVARLDARAPLSAEFLRAAAPGYCTSQQQAEAPEDWFEQALVYATQKLHGAVAALSPAGAGMGQVAGYIVADYLIQYASRERRSARVPASTWDALISHIHDPVDTARLAHSASDRLLYRYAVPLYRHAVDSGDQHSASWLADLLAKRGDLDEAEQILQARTDAGDFSAAIRLSELQVGRIDLDELRAHADAGDETAAERLAGLLARHGDLDELWARADTGNWHAATRLTRLLADRGDLDGLRARADAGDEAAAEWLAQLLADRGDLDGLRARADAGDEAALLQLASLRARPGRRADAHLDACLLAERGDLNELRARADAGDEAASEWLARLLVGRDLDELWARRRAERGDLDDLRARADAGDEAASEWLARLLAGHSYLHELWARRLAKLQAERGDLDGLQARADAGDEAASEWLARLPAGRDLDELWEARRRAALGDLAELLDGLRAEGNARDEAQLARLLAGRSDLEELWVRAGHGDQAAAEWLAELLAKRGDLKMLWDLADDGNRMAATRLAELLDGLRARAGVGDEAAACKLAELLDGLRARAGVGDWKAARRLAKLLAERGDLDELRARADAGDEAAAEWLAELLAKRGDLEGTARILQARADAGDVWAATRLARVLGDRGDLDGLQARINAGDTWAANQLTELLLRQGRGEEADRLHRFGLNPDGSIASA